ncbi:MAG: methionine adenosyltransferase [Bacteroidales bacterium]|nr:methionine adenosyltransferase [Bacteroidales bacterium]
MGYLFTSESVSEGHPDKVADQISDALLDEFLRLDPESRVACETLVTTGLAVCAGEVRTTGWVNIDDIVRNTIREIGYTKSAYKFDADSCGVISTIHEQSGDINMGVNREKAEDQGAGDQGMMFGYACNEMANYMPMPIELAHIFLQELAAIRKEGKVMTYLRPDSKSQITIEYDDDRHPVRIDTIVISTQHDDFDADDDKMLKKIETDVREILIPRVKNSADVPEKAKQMFKGDFKLYVNPTGKFVIGGPHGDTGLTGRKIIVDTYGGRGAHGGGAFSGKDASKVDRSAAYATRHIAKNLVAAGVADEALIQVAYAIGKKDHVGLNIDTYGTAKVKDKNGEIMSDGRIAEVLDSIFDLTPHGIIKRLGLKNPIFTKTATYGHFGREPFEEEVEVHYDPENAEKLINCNKPSCTKMVGFFAWEKLDYVDRIKEAFGI